MKENSVKDIKESYTYNAYDHSLPLDKYNEEEK
jgi:hypothetical protein